MLLRLCPFALLVFILGPLAACAASEHENDPLYKEGYEHGCWTAGAYIPGDKSTRQRDEALFKSNKAYGEGWRMGYRACKIDHPQSGTPGIPDAYRGRGNGPGGGY